MKKRKFRYSDGGDVIYPGDGKQDFDPDELSRASTRDLKAEIDAMRGSEEESKPAPRSSAAPSSESFKDAFAGARRAGNKTFEWQGKRYTTELASGKKPTASEPKTPPTPAPKVKQSIYDTSRDPLVRKVKEAFREPTKAERESKSEMLRESRRGQQSQADTYYGKKSEDRMKDMRGYKSGGKVSASSRADGCVTKGKTKGRMV